MSLSAHTQAVLLLTAYFSKPAEDAAKPLTTKEWSRFARWLKDHDINPEKLMNGHLRMTLEGWTDKYITAERIEKLMHRGSALALAVEKWNRAGLWILTRSDTDYPTRLKQLLKADSPAVIFGCGNKALLNKGGIAVVGARDATNDDLAYSKELGSKAASQGYSIISGGARGVDEASMLGALEAEGTVIGVLADSLLKSSTSNKYRNFLVSKNLVLTSPFYPEAGFNAGNAMARNKYIYCLSDAAVVVQSGTKGGTWNGAIENLKYHRVPLWVKQTKDKNSGNALIINKGGRPMPEEVEKVNISQLFTLGKNFNETYKTDDIFKQPSIRESNKDDEANDSKNEVMGNVNVEYSLENLSFYEFFLMKLKPLTNENAKTTDELLAELELNKTQLNTWLKQAVKDKKVRKLYKPVRYQWQGGEPQLGMFEK